MFFCLLLLLLLFWNSTCWTLWGVGIVVTLGVLAGVGAVELKGAGLVEGIGVAAGVDIGVVCGVSCSVTGCHVSSGKTIYEISSFSLDFVAGREAPTSSLDLYLFRLSISSSYVLLE